MGSRLAKPPPAVRPVASPKSKRSMYPRPFPALTPQSYLPGGAASGPYLPYSHGGAHGTFPALSPNSFLSPMSMGEPPIMNFSGGGMMPQSASFPPLMPITPSMPSVPYAHPGSLSLMAPPPSQAVCEPELPSYCRRRPMRICRRRNRRGRRSRPVIEIIESSSCSSLSSCSTISSCSKRRHRSRTRSRRRKTAQPQQQPIIVLPVPCQQPQGSGMNPAPNSIQQPTQQIVLPPLQIQQSGQYQPLQIQQSGQCQPQQMILPPITGQQSTQLALPGIPGLQQQAITLPPPIQLSSQNFVQSTTSSPFVIPSGQPMMQPSISLPQLTKIEQPQQIQSGTVQYVQATPSSSSPLQYIASTPRSVVAPQRILVNSARKKDLINGNPVGRSASVKNLPQNDLKFGRRPFDWYAKDKTHVIDEKIQVGQRGTGTVH